MNKIILGVAFMAMLPTTTLAWEGYDYESGAYIEIGKGNLVRSGNEIEIYDYNTGRYKDMEVLSIRNRGSKVDIEVEDGCKIRIFEMNK